MAARGSDAAQTRSLHLFMRRMFAALPAKLAHLQTVRSRLPVLGRGVVLVFALGALQLNNFPGHKTSIV